MPVTDTTTETIYKNKPDLHEFTRGVGFICSTFANTLRLVLKRTKGIIESCNRVIFHQAGVMPGV